MVATVAVAGIAAPLAIGVGLGALGFGAAGVGAGTWAAATQAGIGNVVAGSAFAGKQYFPRLEIVENETLFINDCSRSKCRSCWLSRLNYSSCWNRSWSLGWSNLISGKCISGYFGSCHAPNDYFHFDTCYYGHSDFVLNEK